MHITSDPPSTEINRNLANYIKGNKTGICKFDAVDWLLENMYLYAWEIGQNKNQEYNPH